MNKLRLLMETTRRSWSDDPASRGAAKMAAGAALFAEGLFGGVSRFSDAANPLDRRKSKGGLLGSVIVVVIGVVFLFIGMTMRNSMAVSDPATTQGHVVDVEKVTTSDGTEYKATYEYTVDGQTFEVPSGLSSSSRPNIGSTKEITYSTTDPEVAQVTGGMEGMFPWVFVGAGAFAGLMGLWQLLLGLVMIVFGAKLFLSGRKERNSVEADDTRDGFLTDLLDMVRGDKDLPGTDSTPPGTDDHPQVATVPAAGPSGPPAGFYADPDGSDQQRWWDGTQWTEHRQG